MYSFQPNLSASGVAACCCRSSQAEAFALLNHFLPLPRLLLQVYGARKRFRCSEFFGLFAVRDPNPSLHSPAGTSPPSLFIGAAVRWIWLVLNKSPRRGLFSGNKQSLPFPLGEVLKPMPVHPSFLSFSRTPPVFDAGSCW